MVSIYDVDPRRLIEAAAEKLEKMPEMAPPDWADFVKTGAHKMRPPAQKNWWYIRSASVLRAVYKLGPIGVSKLRTKYGGRKNRGHKPDKTFKASGNILRKILQKLELIGFVKQAEKGVHKGRIITPQGKSFLDKISLELKKKNSAPKKKSEASKKKPKQTGNIKKEDKSGKKPNDKTAASDKKKSPDKKPKSPTEKSSGQGSQAKKVEK